MTQRILTVLAAAFSTSAAAAPSVVLSIVPEGAENDTEIFAPEGSEGQVIAARLSAGESAFSVRAVSYELVGSSDACDAGIGHLVRIWKSAALSPAASLRGGQVFEVPEAVDGYARQVVIPLSRPIRLEVGESLFVAVELVRDGDVGMCIAGSSEMPLDTMRQLVSATLETPFAWSSFESAGISAAVDIQAVGFPVKSVN
jgi:hypothetical protein